jgi:UDP-glucose 4-epimerase
VVGDIADRDKLDKLMSTHHFDGVMHFAALIEAGESMKVPAQFFRNNTSNTLTLLEAMLAHGIDRFVFSSTAALYGNPERTPIEENDRLRPTNPYGESKMLVEQMLNWLNQIHGLKYACLRYFNAAGATEELGQDHHPESHLIPLILQVPLGKRKEIAIYGTDYGPRQCAHPLHAGIGKAVATHLQPRYGLGLHCPPSSGCGSRSDGTSDSSCRNSAPSGRSRCPHRKFREDPA